MTTPPTVTARQAAQRLGCSKRTVIRLITTKQLPAHKLTKGQTSPYVIKTADLERYIDERNHPT